MCHISFDFCLGFVFYYHTNPVLSQWNYYIHDHLGNTRVVLDDSGDVKEYYDYYAFGMTQRENVTGSDQARHKFTGKELDDEEMGSDLTIDFSSFVYTYG